MRACIAVMALAASTICGCALPRGPINIDPYVPRWLSHGEVSCDCPPPAAYDGQIAAPHAIEPPLAKFHPVPTRPVFQALLP